MWPVVNWAPATNSEFMMSFQSIFLTLFFLFSPVLFLYFCCSVQSVCISVAFRSFYWSILYRSLRSYIFYGFIHPRCLPLCLWLSLPRNLQVVCVCVCNSCFLSSFSLFSSSLFSYCIKKTRVRCSGMKWPDYIGHENVLDCLCVWKRRGWCVCVPCHPIYLGQSWCVCSTDHFPTDHNVCVCVWGTERVSVCLYRAVHFPKDQTHFHTLES